MMELEQVHAELTELLADVVRVMEQNAIPYSMMCGSLLGTVRHQGFIPWDDDVDLVMTRQSYERFAALYPQQCAAGMQLDLSDTWVPRVRKIGEDAFIDLFVFDPLPDGAFARKWKLFRLQVLQGMLKEHVDYARFSLGKRVLLVGTHVLGLPFSRAQKLRAYERVARSGHGKRVHMSDGAFNLLSMPFDAEAFESPMLVPFGTLMVRIPREPAPVLTQLYGPDYMTPPPESERVPLHLDR